MKSNDAQRTLSPDYYRRRNHRSKVRVSLLALIAACLFLLVSMSLAEGWAVRLLLSTPLAGWELFGCIVFIGVFLGVYCAVLARMTLHINYHIEDASVARTGVISLFLLVYIFVFFKLSAVQPVLHLGASKLLAIFLFFRFWRSQLSEARLKMRTKIPPRIFMVSWPAFFVCRWVLLACWLLVALGFALALVSTHPVIDMEGWEGLSLLSTFYLLFHAFVRNPNAHAAN